MNQNYEHQEHIALIFSIIFPGAGFLYKKKWFTGMLFASIHLIMIALLIYRSVENICYKINGAERMQFDAIIVFILIGISFNWWVNIRKLQNYK